MKSYPPGHEILYYAPATPWKLNTTSGALATEAQIQTVLANLTNLNICGEFSTNTDTSYLSTVSLTES